MKGQVDYPGLALHGRRVKILGPGVLSWPGSYVSPAPPIACWRVRCPDNKRITFLLPKDRVRVLEP